MSEVKINLGGISFQSSLEWLFVPTESFILARPDSRIGLVRIYVADGICRNAADLQAILPALLQSTALSEPFDCKERRVDNLSFGAMSYQLSRNQVDFFARVWYRGISGQLIFAFYGCPWEMREDEASQREQYQCERMILTAQPQPAD